MQKYLILSSLKDMQAHPRPYGWAITIVWKKSQVQFGNGRLLSNIQKISCGIQARRHWWFVFMNLYVLHFKNFFKKTNMSLMSKQNKSVVTLFDKITLAEGTMTKTVKAILQNDITLSTRCRNISSWVHSKVCKLIHRRTAGPLWSSQKKTLVQFGNGCLLSNIQKIICGIQASRD